MTNFRLFHTKKVCRVLRKGLKTLWQKEKLLVTSIFSLSSNAHDEQFLLFLQSFLPYLENTLSFSSNSKLLSANMQTLSVCKSLKFVMWEKVLALINQRSAYKRTSSFSFFHIVFHHFRVENSVKHYTINQ